MNLQNGGQFRSTHEPANPDGDPATADYDPEYYAQIVLRARQDATTSEWQFLAVVIEPHGLFLREWDAGGLKQAAWKLRGNFDSFASDTSVTIPKDAWHEVVVEFGGTDDNDVTVTHTLSGSTTPQTLTATTTITAGGGIGFGVGAKADYWFDDVGLNAHTLVPMTTALRYHYDALGRIVGRTVDPGTPEEQSVFYLYDGDRIVEEVDGSGNVLATYVYGPYVDGNPACTLCAVFCLERYRVASNGQGREREPDC